MNMIAECPAQMKILAEYEKSEGYSQLDCSLKVGHDGAHFDDAYGVRWERV